MTGNAMTSSSITGLLQNVSGTLVLVGAGKMGGAMLAGWVRLGFARTQIVVLEPRPSVEIAALAKTGVRLNPPVKEIRDVAFVVIAIKPQEAEAIAPALKPLIGQNTLVVSVMAGKTVGFLENALGAGAAIVRSMPNTPAAIGRGITVAVPNPKVTPEQRTVVRQYVHKHPLASVSLLGVELNVGSALPDTVELQQVPDVQYRYAIVDNHTVLVDPRTRRIVEVIQ